MNIRRSDVRWLLLAIVAWFVVTIVSPLTLPALAQRSIVPFPNNTDTASVIVDGRALFDVGKAGQITPDQRAKNISSIIEDELDQALRNNKELTVELIDFSESAGLKINSRYLLTVLPSDLPMEDMPSLELANLWKETLEQELQRSREERTSAYQIHALKVSALIFVVAGLIQLVLFRANRRIRRQRLQNKQNAGSPLVLFLSLSQWVVFLGTVVLIMQQFPLTRRWRVMGFEVLMNLFQIHVIRMGRGGISLSQILLVCLLIVGVWFVIRRFTAALRSHILSLAGVDQTLQESIASFIQYGLLGLAILSIFSLAGVDLGAIAIVFGAFGVGIGFGLQNIAKDFVSGIILTFERPIKVGELVQVGEHQGLVLKIGPRVTTISHIDRYVMMMPNSRFIDEVVLNWNRSGLTRVKVYIDVSYGTDIEFVKKVLLEAIQIPHPDVLKHPPPKVKFRRFEENALNFRVVVFIRDPLKQPKVRAEIHDRIARAFNRYHIRVPFPQRDLHLNVPYLEQLTQTYVRQQVSPAEWEALVKESEPPPLPEPQIAEEYDWGKIIEKMRSPGGLDIRDRRYNLRLFPKCFVGSEAVDWLVEQEKSTRDEAILIGQLMMANGLIHHVLDEHGFEDKPLFYRFRCDDLQVNSSEIMTVEHGMEDEDASMRELSQDLGNQDGEGEFDS